MMEESVAESNMEPGPKPLVIDPNNPAGKTLPAPSPTPDGVISLAAWEKVVGEWVNAHVRNSPVALSTDAWNHLMGALTHLRTHVNSHLKG